MLPKLRPVTVMELPPVCAIFSDAAEVTGASNVNACRLVPVIAPTVVYAIAVSEDSAAELHASEVPETHEVQLHAADSNTAVWVKSSLPKFKPVSVIDARPACGTFSKAALATGPSKENTDVAVPAMAPIVT